MFVVAAFAVERESETRGAPRFSLYPFARRQWRIVSHVLAMTTIENRAPVILVIQFEAGDDAMHSFELATETTKTQTTILSLSQGLSASVADISYISSAGKSL